MLQLARLSQVRLQSVFAAHASVHLLVSVHFTLHEPFVHVKLQVSPFLHSQLAPHSRGAPGGGAVSVAPVSREPPPSVPGAGVEPDEDDVEPDEDPEDDAGESVLPVPMFQS